MQQLEIVSGFSDLKSILIRTYNIEKSRQRVRLWFSESDNRLSMHDYYEHKNSVLLSLDGEPMITEYFGRKLVVEALRWPDPVAFLNEEFRANGYYTIRQFPD